MSDFRHDKINEKLIRFKDKFNLARELVDTEDRLKVAIEALEDIKSTGRDWRGEYSIDVAIEALKKLKS